MLTDRIIGRVGADILAKRILREANQIHRTLSDQHKAAIRRAKQKAIAKA